MSDIVNQRDDKITLVGGSKVVFVTDECKVFGWNPDDPITIMALKEGAILITRKN